MADVEEEAEVASEDGKHGEDGSVAHQASGQDGGKNEPSDDEEQVPGMLGQHVVLEEDRELGLVGIGHDGQDSLVLARGETFF